MDLVELRGRLLASSRYLALSTDDERIAFTCLESCAVEAAPGSGKTFLLCGKAAEILKIWRPRFSGICIISHTNAAADAVRDTLSALDVEISYPHFLGTLQTLVDKYFALPFLRGKGMADGITIADDLHRSRVEAYLNMRRYAAVKSFLGKVKNRYESCVGNLRWADASMTALELPFPLGTATRSYQSLLEIKRKIADEGIYAFADMYVFAEGWLQAYPSRNVWPRRFPLVFLDEYQDFDRRQCRFLARLFSASCVQSFGDPNQAIYTEREQADLEETSQTLFGGDARRLPLAKTYRFGGKIARVANLFRCDDGDIVGGDVDDGAPVVITFSDASIHGVIPTFVRLAAERGIEGAGSSICAIGARRNGRHLAQKCFPRDIYEYVPGLPVAEQAGSFCEAMRRVWVGYRERGAGGHSEILEGLEILFRDAVDTREMRQIRRAMRSLDKRRIAEVVVPMFSSRRFLDAEGWASFVGRLGNVLEESGIVGAVGVLHRASWVADDAVGGALPALGGRVRLDTVHAVKGETYDAALVLETYMAQGHELKLCIAAAARRAKRREGESRALSDPEVRRFRRTYVAVTRPRRLLGIALPEVIVTKGVEAFLTSAGAELIEASRSASPA